MIMVGMLQLFFVGLPLIALVASTNPAAFYFVVTAIIFVLCMLLLGGIFVPKIIFMRKEKKPENRTSATLYQSSGHFVTAPPETRDEYTLTENQIPILASKLGCDASELKSILDELRNPSTIAGRSSDESAPAASTEKLKEISEEISLQNDEESVGNM